MLNYSVSKQTQADETTSSVKMYMEAGIHENCNLTSIRVEKSPNGNNFIAFEFVNEHGYTVTHTEWEPKGDDPLKVEQKAAKLIERIKQIVTKFVPEDAFVFEAKSFEDFCKKTKFLLEKYNFNTKKVRIKVIYNDKGFTTLPAYAKFQFIESMDIAKEASKIRILSIDTMVRPQVESNKPNVSFAATTPIVTKHEDPFADMNSPF